MNNSVILLILRQGGGGDTAFCSWDSKNLVSRKLSKFIRFQTVRF